MIDWKEIRDITLAKRKTLTQQEFAAMMTERGQMRRVQKAPLQEIYDFVAGYGGEVV